MNDVLPLFKSHYSLGRSILTLEKHGDSPEDYPCSIIDIAKQNKLKKIFLVDDNMSGFLQAYTNCKDAGISLVFGLRIAICSDMLQKDEAALKETCKYIILAKNTRGYKKLIKIFSKAAQDGFYYYPRIDFSVLESFWSDADLQLAIPFYDSFIFNNVMGSSTCIPNFNYTEPVFFIEENNLPFDPLIKDRVEDYCKDKYETVRTNTIYYRNKEDFLSYLTFRCVNNRSTLNKPQLDHMSSNLFCFENWEEQNGTV